MADRVKACVDCGGRTVGESNICGPCFVRGAKRVAHDPVNHPSHYTNGDIECIDAIRAALTPEEFRGFCKGNAIKYVWRERLKGGGQDLAKAGFYLGRVEGEDK